MAKAKVSQEALVKMAETLSQSAEEIMSAKAEMDSQLRSFVWDDPTGYYFTGKYEEDFKPIQTRLIPRINDFIKHLSQLDIQVSGYAGTAAMVGAGIGAAGAFMKKGIDIVRDIASQPGPIQQMEIEDRKRYQKLQEEINRELEKKEKEKEEKDKTEIFMAKKLGNGKIQWEDKKFEEEFKDWKDTDVAKEMLADAQKSFYDIKPNLEKGITYKQLEDVVNGVIKLKPEEIAYYTTDIGEKGTAGIFYHHLPTNAYVDRVYKGQMSVCQTIGVAAHEGAHVWQYKVSKLSEIWSKPAFLKEENNKLFLLRNKERVDYYNKIRESMKNEEPYEKRFHEKEARKVQYIIGLACTEYYNSTITSKK